MPLPDDVPAARSRLSRVDDSLVAAPRDAPRHRAATSPSSTARRDDGHAALWARVPDRARDVGGDARDPRRLRAVRRRQALGQFVTGSSLDNTLRVCTLVPTDWVLIDVQVHAIAHGFGHGRVELWAEDGTLLATASQSCAVRAWREDRLASLDAVPPPVARRTSGR